MEKTDEEEFEKQMDKLARLGKLAELTKELLALKGKSFTSLLASRSSLPWLPRELDESYSYNENISVDEDIKLASWIVRTVVDKSPRRKKIYLTCLKELRQDIESVAKASAVKFLDLCIKELKREMKKVNSPDPPKDKGDTNVES